MRQRKTGAMRHWASLVRDSFVRLLAVVLICLLASPNVVLAAESSTTSDTTPAKAPPVCTELLLPNGLKVLLLEDHSYPVVSCLSWYRVGSRNERSGNTGVTHLLEHLLFGSVGSFRKGEIGASIARVGGQFNGYTSDDFTTFFETLPSARLELALRIESERMRGAQFSDADVQEEIINIQREFENYSRDPNALLEQELRAMLFLQHPYHNPIIGWRSDLESLNAQVVKAHYDKYFGPNNCTLVIAGDFHTKTVTESVHRYFGGIPKAPDTVQIAKFGQQPQTGERRSTVKYNGKQEVLGMAFHGPSLEDADAPAAVVLEKLLNAPLSGRLKGKLVEPKLCSSASMAFEPKKDPGFIEINCVATPGTANAQQKIIESIDSILGQLRNQPISDAELKRARNLAEFAFYSEREGPYRAGFYLGYFDALSNWKQSESWAQQIRSVTAADVQRVAKKYLSSENRVIAWVAGSAAPKPPAPKSEPTPKSPTSKPEHVHMTGYKEDDSAIAPRQPIPAAVEKTQTKTTPDAVQKLPKTIPDAVQKLPNAIPSAVQKLPAAIGNAPSVVKEIPNAVEAVPTVIKNLPSAVGNIPSVIKQIPGTLQSVPSAIKGIPGAIGGMPGAAVGAVKELPSAIGGIPATAASVIRELPQAVGNIPGATAGAIKSVPAAIGTFATELGGIPSAIGKQLLGPQEQRVAGPTSRRTLKNGMTLVVHESHLSPVVQVMGAARAGTAYEPAGKKGISTVTAQLLNLGTARRGRTQLTTMQEDVGLVQPYMVSFDNSVETLEFGTRCLSRDLAGQLDIIAETLTSPTLADADFEKAKQEAISEIQRAEDTNSRKADRALYRSIFTQGSPLVPEPPSEVCKSIAALTVADERKFLSTNVAPNDTTLVIVGDIDANTAAELVEKAFSAWTPKGAPQKLAAHPNGRQVTRAAVPTKDKTKTTIAFGKLVPGLNSHSEYAQLLIADTAFSKHPLMSRLGQRLSQDESLARAVGSDSIDSTMRRVADGATWSINLDVEPTTVPMTVSALQAELQKFAKEGITQHEFIEARRFVLGSIPVRSLGTIGNTARTLLDGAMRHEHEHSEAALLACVRTSSLDSVNKAIKHNLKPDGATMVVVGSSQSLRATRPQVATQQPTDETTAQTEPVPPEGAKPEQPKTGCPSQIQQPNTGVAAPSDNASH
jgi:zinc protease